MTLEQDCDKGDYETEEEKSQDHWKDWSDEVGTDDKEKGEGESEERDLYTALITEAPYISGMATDLVPVEEIPWFDKTILQDTIKFFRRNLTFNLLSCTFALMYGFAIKPNSAVLLKTGKLTNSELSYKRYLSTILRIRNFFAIFMENDKKSYQALETVRKMHTLASKKPKDEHVAESSKIGGDDVFSEPWKKELSEAMRKDLDHIDTSEAPHHLLTWDPPMPVSQFDMAVTQMGFIGTMWLFPNTFGIKNREEELKAITHIWAIFGRLLGIKDEFNICIKPDIQVYEKLFRNIVVASLKTMDDTAITIQCVFAEAFSKRLPFITYKAMLYFGLLEIEGYTGEHLWKMMSFKDKLSVAILRAWLWGMKNVLVFRYFMHVLTGIWVQLQFWLNLK